MTRPSLALLAGAGLCLTALGACLSERTGPTDSIAGECRLPLSATVPGSTVVIIRNFSFQPAEVRVVAGTSVTWVNCDEPTQPAHTSTADQGQWDSGTLVGGTAYTRTFPQAGRFEYHCEPHPFMTGAVVVQ